MRTFVGAIALLASPAAWAQQALTLDTGSSTVTYTLVHKLHKVNGVSKKAEGKANLAPDGKAQVVVRVPVDSFDSENVNRDSHMKEAVEAAKFPNVELKALGDGLTPPANFPATAKKMFKVQLLFHGIKQQFEVPVDLTWEAANRVRASANFKISLDGYKVERPSLMFVKVDDDLVIDAKLLFK
jgi:polyisoprenoid-binding protein YceI